MEQSSTLPASTQHIERRPRLKKGVCVLKQIRLFRGKVRRYALSRFRPTYVDAQLQARRGECNHCGNCCEILFRCPFLLTQEDGSSHCSIYENRPGSCSAFPLDDRDLADVDFDCTYTFDPEAEIIPIESPDTPETEDTSTKPATVSERPSSTKPIPLLLLQRILNKTP